MAASASADAFQGLIDCPVLKNKISCLRGRNGQPHEVQHAFMLKYGRSLSSCLATGILFGLFLMLSPSTGCAFELKARHATIVYEKEELLREFNKEVSLGSLSLLATSKKSDTAEDEVINKIDAVVEKVEAVLEMFPKNLKLTLVLLSSQKEVQRIYSEKYGISVDYIAFYSRRYKTVYISVDDIHIGVLAHEISHAIMDHYFGVPPPARINEVLGQFVEIHLED